MPEQYADQSVHMTEYKAMQGQVNIDEAQGIVECFVAGIGNKDSVGDICMPGCFTESLKRRKPRVVWGHNWNEPIGKVLDIYEVGPNDPRLPMKMKRAGIGGLYARVQFNLKSERGKQAFLDISFFGEEQEWSIGYKTLNADYDTQRQANLLREVELYEVSPVLHGANQLTSTISIKSDEALRDPDGGLTAAGRRFYNETEGSNLKPGVKGPADTPEKMRRKGSFLTRFFTNPSGPMKDENGEPTRLALSAAAWGEPVPETMEDAKKLAAKGRSLLEKYNAQKKDYNGSEMFDSESDNGESDNRINPAMGRAGELIRAIAGHVGGAVRLRSADENIAVFDRMDSEGEKTTYRIAYYFDGDEFMFGKPQEVKPETIYMPVNASRDFTDETPNGGRGVSDVTSRYEDVMEDYPALPEGVKPKRCKCDSCMKNNVPMEDEQMSLNEPSVKAPVPEVGIPQERFTGDVMRGRGPRRGNLEELLKYWRPIMRREGGFRRCRVILADHPELYPLNNICAWLHHETTGLWPNEGCHHPGMKNCRRKIRGIVNGSIWSDNEWNDRMSKLRSNVGAGKSAEMDDYKSSGMSQEEWESSAVKELKMFINDEPEMVKFISDDNNWEHVGDDDAGDMIIHMQAHGDDENDDDDDCGCGCGGAGDCKPKNPLTGILAALAQLGKSIDSEIDTKAGRVISNRNIQKLEQAMQLLTEVVSASTTPKEPAVQVKADGSMRIVAPIDKILSIKTAINPLLRTHEISVTVDETGIYFDSNLSDEAKSEMIDAVYSFKEANR